MPNIRRAKSRWDIILEIDIIVLSNAQPILYISSFLGSARFLSFYSLFKTRAGFFVFTARAMFFPIVIYVSWLVQVSL